VAARIDEKTYMTGSNFQGWFHTGIVKQLSEVPDHIVVPIIVYVLPGLGFFREKKAFYF